MRVVVDPRAREELAEAVEWMAAHSPAHAAAFRDAYAMMLQRIADHPEWFPEIEPGIRRALIRRFRYSILFTLRSDHALVLVIVHQHRDPEYSRERLR